MSRPGITRRLRHGIVAALTLSSALTFAALYAIGRHERVQAFEQALSDDLRTIGNITQVYPGDDVYVNVEPESLSQYMQGGTRFFQVWDTQDGELLDRSLSLEALDVSIPRPGGVTTTPRRFGGRLPDGREVSWTVVHVRAHWGLDEAMLKRTRQTIEDHPVDLLVGRLSHELDDALTPLAWACVAGALAMPLVAAVALAGLVPRALRPLHALGEAVSVRSSDDLHPFEAQAVEMEPIVQRLNELLQRIAAARERERRFLADAAHELRTPLTELHTLADVALLDPAGSPGHAATLAEMREVSRRMARVVDTLFRLSRQQRADEATPRRRLSLGAVLQEAVQAQSPALAERGLQCRWDGDAEVWIDADAPMARALIDNLLGNAIDHAPAGSTIELRRHDGAAGPALSIVNACSTTGQAPPRHPHLGRGLALAALYAQVLRARLAAGREGDRFEARVAWPDATEPGATNT
ncbi:histidine kinase dimerization/phospho-acceptor domain-containing protein [Caldimonas brevitalea]|uniref:histidine kinase n=1 Tax=Caldimonas brevitalea TaxID=413882 RepID=A0A0G3BUD1_9BURK|nr:histidine kinase dimerization/phospho-acceptor domain-containing protein [Caldimonas brevitalea]AKJ30140.1 two-component sensor histidine kinase [Caldimonas brevitalea]